MFEYTTLICSVVTITTAKGEKESINFPRSTETNEKEEENVREPTYVDTIYVIQ